jgi:hypothetical protein
VSAELIPLRDYSCQAVVVVSGSSLRFSDSNQLPVTNLVDLSIQLRIAEALERQNEILEMRQHGIEPANSMLEVKVEEKHLALFQKAVEFYNTGLGDNFRVKIQRTRTKPRDFELVTVVLDVIYPEDVWGMAMYWADELAKQQGGGQAS